MKTTLNTNPAELGEIKAPKLLKAFEDKQKEDRKKFISDLNECTDTKAILDKWYYRSFLTAGKKATAEFLGVDQLREIIIKRYDKTEEKKHAEFSHRIKYVLEAQDVQKVTITIEWKKNRTWGANPTAEARVSYLNGTCDHFSSGSIGGCGYDKESTAVAKCVNQINGILKALYLKKEKQAKKNNREVFGYGAGYGILPNIEGGVGVSCYPEIFKKIGFEFKGITHGKTFDVYEIVKIN